MPSWFIKSSLIKSVLSVAVVYSVAELEIKYSYVSNADSTPPNPSTIDVMVGSPSKKQMRARDMLQSFGIFFSSEAGYYESETV